MVSRLTKFSLFLAYFATLLTLFSRVLASLYSFKDISVSVNVYEESPSPPVGGVWVPIDKLRLLAPYIGLTIVLALTIVAVLHIRKRRA